MQALMGGGQGQGGGQSQAGLGAMGSEFIAAIEAAESLRIPVIPARLSAPGDVPQEEILKGCVNGLFEGRFRCQSMPARCVMRGAAMHFQSDESAGVSARCARCA
eukprot:1924531-Rhodomonas_salina.1